QMVLDEISAEFYPAPLPQSYRIAPNTPVVEKLILKAKGIETIDSSFAEFAQAASLAMTAAKLDVKYLTTAQAAVPTDLAEAFEKSPAAAARLLNSWTYVNQAPFNETPNIYAFLRGDRPNWGIIAQHYYFERDIEDQVYDELLDYATSSSNRPSIKVV